MYAVETYMQYYPTCSEMKWNWMQIRITLGISNRPKGNSLNQEREMWLLNNLVDLYQSKLNNNLNWTTIQTRNNNWTTKGNTHITIKDFWIENDLHCNL